MPGVKHVCVALDEDGEPVKAFREYRAARDAVDSDRNVVEVVPDVPVID